MAAAMLAITLSLGFWQLDRLAWKRALLADIDRAEAAPPVALSPDSDPPAFRRVVVTGRFLPGTARYGADVRAFEGGYTMGTYLLSAIQPPNGPPVIVDRGWAPDQADPAPPSGIVSVTGYVRPPEQPSRFGAGNDIQGKRFFSLDPAAIGASLGLPAVAPFTLVALGRGEGVVQPTATLPRPPNDHLGYALTWFALAAALVCVFGVFARQGGRRGG